MDGMPMFGYSLFFGEIRETVKLNFLKNKVGRKLGKGYELRASTWI